MSNKPYNILVVCTGNICRSPMVEGILKGRLPEQLAGRVAISSAGTHALHGNRAQPYAIEVMQGFGVDISGHRARLLSRTLVASADLILVMERFHLKFVKMKSFLNSVSIRLLTEYDPDKEPYDVPDPLGEPIAAYEASARIIDNCVKGIHAYLDTIFRNE